MKQRVWLAAMVAVMSLGLVFCGVGQVMAKVGGQCSNCHTMHYSQNGTAGYVIYPDSSTNTLTGGPFRSLTIGGCVGCHTGQNAGGTAADGTIPYVFDDSAEPTGNASLAGGNFYWVEGGSDAKGHNIANASLTPEDANALTSGNLPPGFDDTIAGNAGVNNTEQWTDATGARLTCAGVYGCHGDRSLAGAEDDFVAMSGAHHNGLSSGFADGTTLANSYRFLNTIKGVEDADWEYTNSSSDHNQYHGISRSSGQIGSDTVADTTTISALCAQCHGDFHSNAGGIAYGDDIGNSWLRHPTDLDLSNGGGGSEYASYVTYSVEAPVASDLVADTLHTVQETLQEGTDNDAIVTCVSCHRAHGSANDDLLRWNYTTMNAGNGGAASGSGCFTCHSDKD